MVKVLGIDEAGRGPVIGPMIVAGVMINEKEVKKLGEVKDSKLLYQNQRVKLDKQIKENSEYKILIVDPETIDAAIFSGELNLNWLEAHKQAEIINKLNPDKAIIDCPSINCESYEKYLKDLIKNKKIELVVQHKADLKYPVVSAASILAKVKRESEMDKIKKKYGDTGPGYPSHAKTQAFVRKYYNKYSEIMRKSWSTYKKVAENKGQTTLPDY
tara:strand:+ start:665 stop:1309 length:645 start_codon:yes stop_codon:yes gene_type:complete